MDIAHSHSISVIDDIVHFFMAHCKVKPLDSIGDLCLHIFYLTAALISGELSQCGWRVR